MIYPTYQMGKKIIWDGRTNDGNSFLSCIHPSLIKQVYQQDMKIRLINESIIQVVGSDTPDRFPVTIRWGVLIKIQNPPLACTMGRTI